MNKRLPAYTALSMAVFCTLGAVSSQAQTKPTEFVPFKSFLESTQKADALEFTRPGSHVKDAAAFEEMRLHILNMYRGVEVTHSFVLNSSHFDCVPVGQQPTLTALGLTSIATAPPQSMATKPPTAIDRTESHAKQASQPTGKNQTDEFGNSTTCDQGTIPIRRITLEEMSRFSTLREFLQKGPGNSGQPAKPEPRAVPPATTGAAHKYSFTSQQVDNLGGNANLNLWSPYVNTDWGEVFSLSQEWYIGGSGASQQTAEVGWQNFPDKYGSQDSRLFIYWTADDYNNTGCYNLDCPGFVQVSNTTILGASFETYSTYGGTQYEFSAQYYLYQGNWWLAIQGTWVGYYPGAVYQGGQLTHNAQAIEFGTEGVGTTVWPGEGSGYWSSSGFGVSAYQRNLYYLNTSGNGVWDSLNSDDPSPACYNTSGPFSDFTSDWGIYFYEGGPGGTGC